MRWGVLLAALFLSACAQNIAASSQNIITPSVAIERANQLDGSIVSVRGYLVRGYGNACLFDDAKFAAAPPVSVRDPHALAVLIPNGQVERFKAADHKMVTVTGRFRKAAGSQEIVVDICSVPFVEMQSFQVQ